MSNTNTPKREATPEAFNDHWINDNSYDPCPWCGAIWEHDERTSSGTQHHDEQCPFMLWMNEPEAEDEEEQA